MSDRDREFREDILFPRCGKVLKRIFIPRKLRYDLEAKKSSRRCDFSKFPTATTWTNGRSKNIYSQELDMKTCALSSLLIATKLLVITRIVPYRPKTENEKPHFFIFSQRGVAPLKGIWELTVCTERSEVQNE